MTGESKTTTKRPFLKELPVLIGLSVVMALLVRTFVIQTFWIPSSSMEATLLVDDQLLVNKVVYHLREPERGDIVVFRPPADWHADAQDFIKRVVGVGGDRVACCGPDGRITVNGVPVDEPYVRPGNRPSDTPFDVTVPAGRLFVLGDHRAGSADSRAHAGAGFHGTVPVQNVVGHAFVTIWPLDRLRWHTAPTTLAGIPER